MTRVIRVLVYETRTKEGMQKQLAGSLPDGQSKPIIDGGTVTAYTINPLAYSTITEAIENLREAYQELTSDSFLPVKVPNPVKVPE
jgi:hypothetical protein